MKKEEIEKQLAVIYKTINNPNLSDAMKAQVEAKKIKLEAELENLKELKLPAHMTAIYVNTDWEGDVYDAIEEIGDMTRSDAQGVAEVQHKTMEKCFNSKKTARQTAKIILKASVVKPKKNKKSPLGISVEKIVEREKTGDNAIVKGKKQKSKEKFSEIDTEKKWKHESVVIKHSDEHYIVLYAGDTKNDAEVKFIDGQWELICKQVKDYPKFKMDEIEDAINFVLEIKHFIATRPERQEKAKKRAKINANKSEAKKAEEAVEKVAESVEEKIEQLKEEGKKVTETTANNIALDVKTIVKAVKSGMKAEERRKFVNKLINELKKLL